MSDAPAPLVGAVIEARMTSTRLPGKVLMTALGRPMLALMIERLRRAPSLQRIVIATTDNTTDDPIERLAEELGAGVFRGSEHDVMGRVLAAARAHTLDVIVETTGDCPLVDPLIVEQVIGVYTQGRHDYVANNTEPGLPDGMDVRVFSTRTLADAERRTSESYDREHVTPYLCRHPDRYRCLNLEPPDELRWPALRLTLDTAEDLARIRAVFEGLYHRKPDFGLVDMLAFLRAHPSLINEDARATDPAGLRDGR